MRLLFLLLPLLLIGCTSARDRAIERAVAAAGRGDLVEAARAWADACALAPEDCDRAAQAREAAVVDATQAASPACTGGDTARCAEALRRARELAPNDDRLLALAEEAGRLQLAACDHAQDLPGLRCAERWRGALAVHGYGVALAGQRAALAEAIARQASGDAGADAQRLGAAACLDGSRGRREAAAAAARAWDEAIALPLAIGWQVRGAPPLVGCAELVGSWPLVCGAGGMVVEVTGAVERVRHERHVSSQPVEWIAGTRAVPNPAYGPAATRVHLAADTLRAIEGDLARASSYCDAAEQALRSASLCHDCRERRHRDVACEQEDALASQESQQRRELRDAESELGRTPRFFEEPVRRIAHVDQVDHTWSAPWRATVQLLQGAALSPARSGAQRSVSGVAVHRDTEHAGLRAASFDADPLEPPPADLGAADLAASARVAAGSLVGDALLALANERARACPDAGNTDDASLRCRAEVRRLSGQPADGSELLTTLAGGRIACR